jgi:putative membrane protein
MHDMNWMFGGWGLIGLLLWIVPFFFLFYALKGRADSRQATARELLDQAYARGELSRDEYLRRREDIAKP